MVPINQQPTTNNQQQFLEMGFEERRLERKRAEPAVESFCAPTVDREAEEIARRILTLVAAGTEFREIGIIVRNQDVYLPALRASLERFGIPARFYFPGALNKHGVVRYLAGLVTALIGGWDHAETLAALRLSGDSPALDRFDFAVREQLPGSGLGGLRALTEDSGLQRQLDDLAAMEPWREQTLTPAQWVSRIAGLAQVGQAIRLPNPVASPAPQWLRGHATALAAFE